MKQVGARTHIVSCRGYRVKHDLFLQLLFGELIIEIVNCHGEMKQRVYSKIWNPVNFITELSERVNDAPANMYRGNCM